jgi:hypothetical protein
MYEKAVPSNCLNAKRASPPLSRCLSSNSADAQNKRHQPSTLSYRWTCGCSLSCHLRSGARLSFSARAPRLSEELHSRRKRSCLVFVPWLRLIASRNRRLVSVPCPRRPLLSRPGLSRLLSPTPSYPTLGMHMHARVLRSRRDVGSYILHLLAHSIIRQLPRFALLDLAFRPHCPFGHLQLSCACISLRPYCVLQPHRPCSRISPAAR